jgi:ectoine hydroxylase
LIEELGAIEPTRRIKTGTFTFDWLEDLDTTVKWERGVEGRKVRGLEFFAHLSPAIMAWAMDPRLTDPCKAACDAEEVVLFTEKLNMKRAELGGPVELHQDFPYWVDFAPHAGRVVTAMLFLDDATQENGCLQVAPASHRDGERPKRTDANGLDLLQMDQSQFDLTSLLPLEVPAGSVVYFGAYLVHCSSPNRSGKDRRALLYSYQPSCYAHARDLMRAQRDAAAKAESH